MTLLQAGSGSLCGLQDLHLDVDRHIWRSTCLSTLVFWRHVTLAEPMSPDVENLMPSLVTPMTTVSPMDDSSLTMRLNSAAGMRTLHTGGTDTSCRLQSSLTAQHEQQGCVPAVCATSPAETHSL